MKHTQKERGRRTTMRPAASAQVPSDDDVIQGILQRATKRAQELKVPALDRPSRAITPDEARALVASLPDLAP